MPELFSYLLKINIAISLFYFGYFFFLEKLTFYSLNRIYLVFSLVFAAVFPFFSLPEIFNRSEVVPYSLHGLESSLAFIPQGEEKQSFIWLGITVLYWAMVAFGFIKLASRLVSLYKIHIQSVPDKWKGYSFRYLKEEGAPFSFLGTIYLNKEMHSDRELNIILKHEQEHTQGLHSLDVLLAEVWLIFSWFSPVSQLLKKAIKVNIEFIADREVVNQGVSQQQYQYNLVQFAIQSTYLPLVNQFGFLSLKARITMMNKKQSSKRQLGKYILLIPVIVSSLFVFGVSNAYEAGRSLELILDLPVDDGNQSPKEVFTVADQPLLQDSVTVKKRSISGPKTVKVTVDLNRPVPGDPLTVIDGVIQEERFDGNLPNEIGPDNIESITILKEESATTLYGDRGKNGVILVTTKMVVSDDVKAKAVKEVKGSSKKVAANKSNAMEDDSSWKGASPIHFNNVRGTEELQFEERPASLLFERNRGSVLKADGQEGVLYLIDGRQVDSKAFLKLDVSQIESINVIKDAKTLRGYGDRARNGLVRIVLKK